MWFLHCVTRSARFLVGHSGPHANNVTVAKICSKRTRVFSPCIRRLAAPVGESAIFHSVLSVDNVARPTGEEGLVVFYYCCRSVIIFLKYMPFNVSNQAELWHDAGKQLLTANFLADRTIDVRLESQ